MDLREMIGIHLDQIKQVEGVENVVLSYIDGNPIQSTGIWFSKDEIFNVCSATSAIYNMSIHLHSDDLQYILVEGKKAKIVIIPFLNPFHFSLDQTLLLKGIINTKIGLFIAITAQPTADLRKIVVYTKKCLERIKATQITSGESFKPPLIQFNDQKIQNIIEGFNVKEDENLNYKISSSSFSITENISLELRKILNNFSIAIPDLKYAYITIEGGFLASKIIKSIKKFNETEAILNNISEMSYSLFQTANRCAWLLKKMKAERILLDCENAFLFIYGLGNAFFSTEIEYIKVKVPSIQWIKQLRMRKSFKKLSQISHSIDELVKLVKEALKQCENKRDFDIRGLLGELVIK